MNNNCYRLVFSKRRGMLVAVSETATAHTTGHGETGQSPVLCAITLFAMRHAAFASLGLFGLAPVLADAQIVPSGAHAPNVISTANGLPQVNVTKPSGAGVSLNTYSQFDVSRRGAILNNSPVNVKTQLAGQISGNPNFGANDAAKIIVNQVNSNNPSVLKGYVEVAGAKTAAVVIANSSGLVVDGGGFINTSKGILTTGNPLVDGNGNLTGFSVTGGTITVQGAGLNASNIDEVDLLSRAVQVNAAIYANTLNVTTGSNNIDYAGLTPAAIAGGGPAPGVSIDVSQLGGMYSGAIKLVGTENGVGVANAGSIAAQAGGLTLTTTGQLVQSGQMTATGNLGINAAGVANSGSIYAQQSTAIASDAGGSVAANATGSVINDNGTLAGGSSVTLTGANISNQGGQVSAEGPLVAQASGQISNQAGLMVSQGAMQVQGGAIVNSRGTMQGAAGMSVSGTSVDNTAGRITSLNGDGLSVTATGAISNANGTIESNGRVVAEADTFDNAGGLVRGQMGLTATVNGALNNTNGSLLSNADLSLASGTLNNNGGEVGAVSNETIQSGSMTNIFLDRYYDRGGGVDTLGDILSAISQTIWADGSPNDPAQWQDWLDAIKEAKK